MYILQIEERCCSTNLHLDRDTDIYQHYQRIDLFWNRYDYINKSAHMINSATRSMHSETRRCQAKVKARIISHCRILRRVSLLSNNLDGQQWPSACVAGKCFPFAHSLWRLSMNVWGAFQKAFPCSTVGRWNKCEKSVTGSSIWDIHLRRAFRRRTMYLRCLVAGNPNITGDKVHVVSV